VTKTAIAEKPHLPHVEEDGAKPAEAPQVTQTLDEKIAELLATGPEYPSVFFGLAAYQTRHAIEDAEREGREALFRRLFLEMLVAARDAGRFQFFGDHVGLADHAAFNAYIAPLRGIDWVVYAKKPFAGPEQVLRYLSRYTHRIAISNRRLIAADEKSVTFKYKDYRIEGPGRYTSQARVLSNDELKAIWEATADESNFSTIVRLLILLGQRPREVAALRSDYITEDTINLPGWLCKNGRDHSFPISPLTATLLDTITPNPFGLLFPARGKDEHPFNGWSKSQWALNEKLGGKVAPWHSYSCHASNPPPTPRRSRAAPRPPPDRDRPAGNPADRRCDRRRRRLLHAGLSDGASLRRTPGGDGRGG
jgi:integrase